MSSSTVNAKRTPHVLNELATLLVVDDDPILREFAVVNLATDAVDVVAAADGIEALDYLEAATFDLLLVDLEMPRLDGFGLLERLRSDARWAHLPVIVVTGREDIASIDRAYQAGATAFTVKPLNWRLLSYQIRFVLRAQKAERAAAAHRGEVCAALDNQADLVDDLISICRAGSELADVDSHRKLLSAVNAHLADLQVRSPKLS